MNLNKKVATLVVFIYRYLYITIIKVVIILRIALDPPVNISPVESP